MMRILQRSPAKSPPSASWSGPDELHHQCTTAPTLLAELPPPSIVGQTANLPPQQRADNAHYVKLKEGATSLRSAVCLCLLLVEPPGVILARWVRTRCCPMAASH